MRADALRNIEKLRAAALEAFRENGLGVPLEDVARRAGVSTGTLYNRFGTREALIDAVAVELAGECLDGIVAAADAALDGWSALELFLIGVGELQAANPAFSDIVSARFVSPEVQAICHRAMDRGADYARAARAEGSARADLSEADLAQIVVTNAAVLRAREDPADVGWRRHLRLVVDGLRAR